MIDGPDNFMLIGLHKLAAERGDGLIPELLLHLKSRQAVVEAEQRNSAREYAPAGPDLVVGNDNVIVLSQIRNRKRGR